MQEWKERGEYHRFSQVVFDGIKRPLVPLPPESHMSQTLMSYQAHDTYSLVPVIMQSCITLLGYVCWSEHDLIFWLKLCS
jgi:hypothetical protein